MSHYPPPYQPPQGPVGFGYTPPQASPAAKRASIFLYLLGGLCIPCGLCLGIASRLVPVDRFVDQIRSQLSQQQLDQLNGIDLPSLFRTVYLAVGITACVIGIILLILGFFVWRGGRGAIITSLIFCVLGLLLAILGVISGLINGMALSQSGYVAALIWLIIGAALALLTVWLFQALRASSVARMQPMPPWGQQQAAGASPYGPAEYGYGTPPQTGINPQQWMQPPAPPPKSGEGPSQNP